MKKDAGVAAVLNTIYPGLGWIYCESLVIGILSVIFNTFSLLFSILYPVFYFAWAIFWVISIVMVCEHVKELNLSDKNKNS